MPNFLSKSPTPFHQRVNGGTRLRIHVVVNAERRFDIRDKSSACVERDIMVIRSSLETYFLAPVATGVMTGAFRQRGNPKFAHDRRLRLGLYAIGRSRKSEPIAKARQRLSQVSQYVRRQQQPPARS